MNARHFAYPTCDYRTGWVRLTLVTGTRMVVRAVTFADAAKLVKSPGSIRCFEWVDPGPDYAFARDVPA